MKPASALPPDDVTAQRATETAAPQRVPEEEYRPFPMKETRNDRQENLEVPLVIRTLGLPSGQRMLELGCGCGIALVPFSDRCKPSRLVGLDIDPELLSQAERHVRERGVQAELILGDARTMPFPEGSFDIVVDFGTLYHIARREAALA
jgi:ubiquinone/menaquinone biosynthesis C-methylase UbiE